MAMKAKAMAKSSEKEEAKAENKVEEKKSDEKQVPYRYKGEDGNWAWKLK